MQNTTGLSNSEHVLREDYLRGNLSDTASAVESIPPRLLAESAPLSFEQEQLWFFTQLIPNLPVLNECLTIRFTSELNVTALEQSLNEFIDRHEIWRTSFPTVDGQPVQVIHPVSNLKLSVVDLRNLPETERESEALRLATEDVMRPFDLAHYPLLRALLIHQGEEDYRLFMTLHQIIIDTISIYQVFLPELSILYESFSRGKPSPLAPLPVQYADFAAWERKSLQEDTLAEHLTYWKQQLADAPPVLDLPADRPRPPMQSFRGSMQPFTLSSHLTEALKAFSHQEGVPLDTTLKAAFQALLHRYTGQDDLLLGTITSSRKCPTGLVGYFLNTVVLRANVSGNPTFRELLKQIHTVSISNGQHDVPFEYIVKELYPVRNLSYHPLVQVTLSYHPQLSALPSGWTVYPISQAAVQTHTSKFDLCLELDDRPEGLIGRFIYNSDLFDDSTISRMVGHWQTILEGIVADPSQHLSELPLLTEQERRLLLVEWNDTATGYPRDQCIHQMFEAQVVRTPHAVAAICENEYLTYHQLNSKSNQLAHNLQALGVGPDVLVGICLERSLELVVGLLGVLKAGGAYVPLDPSYPHERLAFMAQDAHLSVILTQQRLLDDLPTFQAQILCLDRLNWQPSSPEDTLLHDAGLLNVGSGVRAENLAYVIYTSGSTGTPKGVMISHRALCNHMCWLQDMYPLTPADRVLQKTAFSFDVSIWEFFWPLLTGARLVLARPGGHRDPAYLVELIVSEQISVCYFVASMLSVFLQAPGLHRCQSLKHVFCGGEALPFSVQQQFFAQQLSAQLHNIYGPTETTIDVTSWTCQPESSRQVVPIGRPIANTQMYVLDKHLQLVPVGVSGELYIGGDGLARGYLNRPELTKDRFIRHPFSTEPDARLYKTGDLARFWPDGTIELIGRNDYQVKIRGFRIELGEIEAALSQHPAVREAVVMAREDSPADKRLVAYVVLHQHQPLTVSDLRDHVLNSLPTYMVPSAFVPLESLPLTPGGKLDRRALPAPDGNHLELKETFVAPRSAIEEVLADIWAHVLRLERVGVHDNFFELGGDSILSLQIIAQAHQAGLALTPKHLFQYQTIAQLAAVVTSSHPVEAQQGAVTGIVPLTPIQHWFFEQHFVAPHHWNQAWLLEVNEPVEVRLLEQALHHVLAHHDALRLRFQPQASGWLQVHEECERAQVFRQVALSGLAAAEQQGALEAMAAQAQASLHLATGPLVRCVYLQLGSNQPARLLIVIHHLVVDGVSWRILLEDLTSAYRQLREGQVPHLPAKTTSFQQWAQRLSEYARLAAVRQELPYWLHVASSHPSPLPVDSPADRETITMAWAHTVEGSLSAEETEALLHAVPKAYHTQINEVLLTALVQAFAQWTGERTLLLDLEGHGREPIQEEVNLARTVGWFTTIFPVCLRLQDSSPAAALKAVKEQLRHIPNHGLGYGVLRYLGEQEDIERLKWLPRAQVSFNYLGQFDQMVSERDLFKLARESAGPTSHLQATQPYLLEINGLVIDGHLEISWLYNERVHQRGTIEWLAASYLQALRALIAHCQSPEAGGYTPSDFALARLTEQELQTVVSALSRVADSPSTASRRKCRELEDLYPLSPLQQGMLFHSRYAPGSGVYINQFHYRLQGNLDSAAFKRAWQQVVARHAIFRTTFLWEGLREPLQVVQRQLDVALQEQDWRGLSAGQQDERIAEYLKADRREDFDLIQGPLMRVSLLRTADNHYYLTWTQHHLVLDGWSLPLVLKEVFAYYEAFRQGQEPHLPPAPLYRDYIAWLQQQDQEQAERFWRSALQGFTMPTLLPFDQAPGRKGSAQAEMYQEQHLQLSETTTARLHTLASQQQLTLNTVVQGAWALLLNRYSGENDVLFGATTSGRSAALPGIEFLVGPYINTLPVRVQIPAQARLVPWLKDLQMQQVEARQYEYSSLVQIQGWSQVPHTLPLFESLLVFENYPLSHQERAELELDTIGGSEQTNYPLVLAVGPGRELSIQIIYDRSRFDPTTIRRITGHLQTLLESLAHHPEQTVHEVGVLTAAERQQMLVDWNATQAAYPQDQGVHQLFEAQVERTPDAVALVCEHRQLTYGELNRKANQLAHYLQEVGVGPEVMVGLCVERSPEMIIGLLGILKAGGVYVPLDPEYPQQRLIFLLQDTRMPVLLTQHRLLSRFAQQPVQLVCLDSDGDTIGRQSETNPSSGIRGEHLAYVIYTSGSTGQPKGVLIPHGALAAHCWSMAQVYELRAEDCILQFSSFTFDASLEQILPTLLVGARLVLRGTDLWSPEQLLQQIKQQQLSVINLPPAYWQQVTQAWLPVAERLRGHHLRLVIVGGDQLPPEALRLWRQTPLGAVRLLNAYGPTETTITATLYDTADCADGSASFQRMPIGRPLANRRVYVLDGAGHPVPIGVVGELHIGGELLARGYLNRPDLTAERFLPDPFSRQPDARLYKTGDLVRYLPDGTLEFMGRVDQQVKIRGFRIEVGEIEAVLRQHPAVREVAVVARQDSPGDKSLVAYVVARQGQVLNGQALRSYLKEKLPAYMLPAAFVWLETLPLLATGKLDRQALPVPDYTPSSASKPSERPRTALEEVVAHAWSQALGIESIDIHEDFFTLGGHSLLALQVASQLRSSLQVELPLRSFFEAPTIAQLAEIIPHLQAQGAAPQMPALGTFSREAYRVSAKRERIEQR